MASSFPARSSSRPWIAARAPLTLATFTAALFVSALLLFSVQPMFTRFVLPRLGGSPAVWSTAMVFFQAVLLAGYGYAHLLARYFNVRNGALLHVTLLAVTMLMLPIAVAAGWGRPPESGQALWLIGLFAASVGLPFFAVAATGPLLQAWFSRSGHRHAADPYFLYGASNLGSFAALLLYPALFEPVFTLGEQSLLWSFGFVAFVALIGGSALLVLGPAGNGVVAAAPAVARPWRERMTWVALAFVPSALLVAVTAHISTDIAAAPFLWVVPLSLYLLTFVITFQRRPLIPHWLVLRVLPFVVVPLALVVATGIGGNIIFLVALHLVFFFVAALACHGELVRLRPPPASLTEFYLWMSFGGVLGGIFCALVAPQVFSTVLEYPILVVASLFALPALRIGGFRAVARPLGAALALTMAALVPATVGFAIPDNIYAGALCGFAALAIVQFRRPVMLTAVVGALVALGLAYQPQAGLSESYRSFFGVNRVTVTADGKFRVLFHGRTVHGAERILNDDGTPYAGPPEPTTYYYFGGPLGEAVAAAQAKQGTLARVASVGLGTGSLACHAKPYEDWRFYEIDPEVARIATSSSFSFLSRCAPQAPIILGDARLTLADEPAGYFGLIVIDAFSSDAVPVHLLTQEAFAGYFEKLAPGGLLVLHISNKFMDLAPVVVASAAANGLGAWLGTGTLSGLDPETLRMGSLVAVVGRNVRDIGPLALAPNWHPLSPDADFRTWTDDYSNILGALVRGL